MVKTNDMSSVGRFPLEIKLTKTDLRCDDA